MAADKKLPRGIYRKKNGLYEGRFQYQEKSYSIYGRNVKKLEKELAELRYEVEHGIKGKGDDISLDEWFEIWLYDYKRMTIKETTMNRYEDYYDRYIRPKLGQKSLSFFKPIMIQRHLNQMAEDDYSTKTIADTYNILHSMFKVAVQNEMLNKNPCDAVILPKTKKKEKRVLTIEEQQAVLEYSKGRLCENLVRVALGTGMRVGELHGLTWKDIDFEAREIHVNKTLVYVRNKDSGKYGFKFQIPKTMSSIRTIPMPDAVYYALRKQKELLKDMKLCAKHWNPTPGFENMVFLNVSGRPRQSIDFRNDLERVKQAINKDRKKLAKKENREPELMEHFYPHSLRHTFATRCFEAGIDAKTVQIYLGHASIAITMDLYTHVTDEKSREEMEKLDRLYKQIGQEK